ncbi:MAG: hypothetical protein IPI01_15025 [Ignavibacteriae bacterium]|nr:hypothetical protein [Ignavibacteriota bacterium]
MMLRTTLLALLLCAAPILRAQPHAQFNLFLDLNYTSAEKTVELYEGLSGRPSDIAALRGSQLSLAVTAMLAQKHLTTGHLEQSLEAAKFNQSDGDDDFRMRPARAAVRQIRELLDAVRRRNFGQRVISTVEQLFPADARVNARIPMYFVAFGHQNIDAFVVRINWEGDVPHPAADNEGEPVIVVNLARAVNYGTSVDECFVGLLSVVAHEVFHAAFEVYKRGSPFWQSYYAVDLPPFDELLDLAHNEGVAYYLSLIQRTGGRLPTDGLERAQSSMHTFNAMCAELLSQRTPPGRAAEILRRANTSGYWESYGSITGMIVARQIDQSLGRVALVETLRNGPRAFFRTYLQLMKQDRGIPQLSPLVQQELARQDR